MVNAAVVVVDWVLDVGGMVLEMVLCFMIIMSVEGSRGGGGGGGCWWVRWWRVVVVAMVCCDDRVSMLNTTSKKKKKVSLRTTG